MNTIKKPHHKKRKLLFHHDPSVETIERSVMKTITYRIIIGIMEFSFVFLVTGRAMIAFGFIAISSIYSIFTFYFHDRIWDKIKWGKVDPE